MDGEQSQSEVGLMTLGRRELLVGMGALAVSSGALLGTAAFTDREFTRDFDIGVLGDDAGQLRLEPTGETDVISLEEVGDDGVEVITFDFEDINAYGNTSFGEAFTITNQSELDESLWVFAPRAVDGDDEGVSDAIQESAEFLVDTEADDVETPPDPFGQAGGIDDVGDVFDFSLPPAYPDEFSEHPDNPNATSAGALEKTVYTGGFELAAGGSVTVSVNLLGLPLDPGEDRGLTFRLVAAQEEPEFPDDWDEEPTISAGGGDDA